MSTRNRRRGGGPPRGGPRGGPRRGPRGPGGRPPPGNNPRQPLLGDKNKNELGDSDMSSEGAPEVDSGGGSGGGGGLGLLAALLFLILLTLSILHNEEVIKIPLLSDHSCPANQNVVSEGGEALIVTETTEEPQVEEEKEEEKKEEEEKKDEDKKDEEKKDEDKKDEEKKDEEKKDEKDDGKKIELVDPVEEKKTKAEQTFLSMFFRSSPFQVQGQSATYLWLAQTFEWYGEKDPEKICLAKSEIKVLEGGCNEEKELLLAKFTGLSAKRCACECEDYGCISFSHSGELCNLYNGVCTKKELPGWRTYDIVQPVEFKDDNAPKAAEVEVGITPIHPRRSLQDEEAEEENDGEEEENEQEDAEEKEQEKAEDVETTEAAKAAAKKEAAPETTAAQTTAEVKVTTAKPAEAVQTTAAAKQAQEAQTPAPAAATTAAVKPAPTTATPQTTAEAKKNLKKIRHSFPKDSIALTLEEYFNEYRSNVESLYLTAGQLGLMISGVCKKFETAVPHEDQMKLIVDAMDTNKDAKISFEEVYTVLSPILREMTGISDLTEKADAKEEEKKKL